jgi:histidine kinase/DNA gyrase B/HSP90-like ATPase
MTRASAAWVGRSLLAITVLLVGTGMFLSIQIVNVPIARPIIVGDATIADGPSVLTHIEQQIADGTVHLPTAPGTASVSSTILLLLWVCTGTLIVSRQPRNLAGWVFIGLGMSWAAESFGFAVTAWSLIRVESAIYFCSLEALNNVAKYAQATRATIDLAQQDGRLRFTVHDDGAGFDMMTTSYGTGLQGMADRLDAIGGSIRVDSAPGTGTIVTGTVPVGSDQTEAASQAASSLSGPNDDLGM